MCFDHKKLTLGAVYGLLANLGSAAIFALIVSQINPKLLATLTSPGYLMYVLGTTAVIAFLTSMAGTWDFKKTFTLLAAVIVGFVAWVHTIPDGLTLFKHDPWLYAYAGAAIAIMYLSAKYYKTDVAQKTIILLSILGIILTLNLNYIHWKLVYDPNYVSPCQAGESISCDAVNSSEYAEIFGIPVAFFGMAFYIILIVLAWLSTTENQKAYGKLPVLMLFGAGLGGIAFTLYLTSIEEFVLGIWCPLCVVSAFLSVIVFLSASKLVDSDAFGYAKQVFSPAVAVPQTVAAPAIVAPPMPAMKKEVAAPKKKKKKVAAKRKRR